ncbi:aryl-alcohol dehydrogenase [Pseudozyma hubeiensis SY62]|uniref:Aryl-alcohol dehydrogenase n=1 Tax=Pseudozyma hubeiensis (strain SY62) TaxID=1305764 RepID=R9NYB6_PSEHS|nr:aryl-alcohol dehydrogenase [Pseudozyma hubeiensis SY62]GAC93758.1 aryl-alcohol dehydrogenase [Pseudozyma hubeiensis SY62]
MALVDIAPCADVGETCHCLRRPSSRGSSEQPSGFRRQPRITAGQSESFLRSNSDMHLKGLVDAIWRQRALQRKLCGAARDAAALSPNLPWRQMSRSFRLV